MRHTGILLLAILAAAPICHAFAAEQRTENPSARTDSPDTLSGKLVRTNNDINANGPYALVDRSGMICGYVTAPSGLDLRWYCGKTVTVEGTSRPGPDAGAPHMVARRLVTAEEQAAAKPAAQPIATTTPPKPVNLGIPDKMNKIEAARRVAFQEAAAPPAKGPEPIPLPAGEVERPAPAPRTHGQAVIEENPPFEDGPAAGCGHGGCGHAACNDACDDCGPSCGSCCNPCDSCCLWDRGAFWARMDYLLWWTEGMRVPPLVTSGPTPAQPGYLDHAGTVILFGDTGLFQDVRSGGRLQLGMWLDGCEELGIEGEYLALQNDSVHYRIWSDGNPIVSRPFYDVTRPASDPQNVERVAFPRGNAGSLDGSVSVDALTKFQSAGARFRLNLCRDGCGDGCGDCCEDACGPSLCQYSYRRDFVFGYRFMRLDDGLGIHEELTSTDATIPGAFVVDDVFQTTNTFHGGELGMLIQSRRGRWSLDLLGKVALGNSHETVGINGSTRTTEANGTQHTDEGGLLALSSNIGQYSRNVFAVVPEAGATLGYQLTPRLRGTVGYSFIYWSNVMRAGSAIDIKVNPTLLPNAGTVSGDTTHPAFAFKNGDFWAQGLNFGLDYRW